MRLLSAAALRQGHQAPVLGCDLIPRALKSRWDQFPCCRPQRAFELEVLEVRSPDRGGKLGIRLGEQPVCEFEATFIGREVAATLGRLCERSERSHLHVEHAAAVLQLAAEFGELRNEGRDEILMRVSRHALLPLPN